VKFVNLSQGKIKVNGRLIVLISILGSLTLELLASATSWCTTGVTVVSVTTVAALVLGSVHEVGGTTSVVGGVTSVVVTAVLLLGTITMSGDVEVVVEIVCVESVIGRAVELAV